MTSRSKKVRRLTSDDRRELAAVTHGPVLLPDDEGYDGEPSSVNLAVPYEPDVVVGASDATDVREAVRFAGDHGLTCAVLATGHGPALPVRGGMLITTRRMTQVVVDPVARTARVGAGVRWQQAVDAAAAHGLAPLAGSAPGVGVVGYTLGGGLSVTMGRAHGWAADHVTVIEVVTPDGVVRRATADSEPDLFWALLGGKSNFGVVTALEFGLFPVTRLYAGGLFFAGEHTSEVLHAYQRLATTAPEDLMSSVAILRIPDIPSVPALLREKLMVHVRIAYLGSRAAGANLVAPLRAAAPTALDSVRDRPYTEFGTIAPGPGEPTPTVEQFTLLRELTPETVDALIEAAGPGRDPSINVIDIRHLGGALRKRHGESRNAVDPLESEFLLITSTVVARGTGDEHRGAGLHLRDTLRPWLDGRRHANFLAPSDAAGDLTREAFRGPTYERLQTIKASVDPANMFRANHNIPPAG